MQDKYSWLDSLLWKLKPCKAPSKCGWALNGNCMCGASDLRKEAKAKIIMALEQSELGRRDLMAERRALKLTQADMAAVIGVSRVTYIKWEKNMMLMPIGRYRQICLEFNRLSELKNIEAKEVDNG